MMSSHCRLEQLFGPRKLRKEPIFIIYSKDKEGFLEILSESLLQAGANSL